MPNTEPRWLSILRIILSVANLVPEIVVPILRPKDLKALQDKNEEQARLIEDLKSRQYVSQVRRYEQVEGDATPRLIEVEDFPPHTNIIDSDIPGASSGGSQEEVEA